MEVTYVSPLHATLINLPNLHSSECNQMRQTAIVNESVFG